MFAFLWRKECLSSLSAYHADTHQTTKAACLAIFHSTRQKCMFQLLLAIVRELTSCPGTNSITNQFRTADLGLTFGQASTLVYEILIT